MSQRGFYDTGRSDILRRLEAIGARVEAVSRRAGALLQASNESPRRTLPDEDPVRHLQEIESNLEALEERLKKMEKDMRHKESPPETFGSTNEFSTGPHFPGLG